MKFFGKVYGFTFTSDFDLKEIQKIKEEGEIRIYNKKLPENLERIERQGPCYQQNKDSFLLKVDNTAKYCIIKGNEILVEKHPASAWRTVRMLLYTTPFGVLLHQRGLFPLHASAVFTEQGALLFAGPSAVGKTTLALRFYLQGYNIIADDISALELDSSNRCYVHPGIDKFRVWKDVLYSFDISTEQLVRTHDKVERYYFPFLIRKVKSPVKIRALFFMERPDTGRIEINEIHGGDKILHLTENIYRMAYLSSMELQKKAMEMGVVIANETPFYLLKNPLDLTDVDDVVDAILNTIDSNGR